MSSTLKTDFSPKVAIIGRPNVGKSTLFNIITETRKAVVKNQAGVTRDIMIEPVDIWGKQFDLIDTGGITEAGDIFSKLIKEQVTEFLHSVDLIVAVMDGRVGLVPEDRDIIRVAKQTGKPFLLVINKVDSDQDQDMAKADFYEFGVDVVAASFEQRRGLAEILEWVVKQIPENPGTVKEGMNIAIVGKPNVGKSSICNAILGYNRMIVSDIAGTTIDSVDSPFVYNDKKYTLVDTAGLRRSAKREEDLEIISAFKSQEAIRRADIVLLMVDGTVGPTDQDARIMQAILEDHKGVIVVANKSDLGGKEVPEYRKTFREQVERVFHFFTDVHIVFTSAKTGYGLEDLFEMIEKVAHQMTFRVPTAELNDFFFETIRKAPAPVWGTTNVKFYYLTQTYQQPPAFIAFANHPDGVTNSYRRFLIKHIKTNWDLHGMPIRIFCMKSRRGGSDNG
ncbi:ribosome biogenesis GTPase Der [Bdellovibrio bacteriovorus]|uniref:GTPase Der n=1 Tax=Bdellovibrio bacteriovorus (strain ATCC 15356 / DSM 50701 / NCIMB 9529 / HD100) TaxID=264462 RepID=Q6MLR3_BDEBA|nr:ribosome biogenesis GTPase Der [Bdellovibrio bacteriovorus]AHZ84441.1 GTP-binding protein [Bdellovibrio bacteriovorus]BEV68330.1 GTPase Der [Bdellovibrio bacteriovorus]CAE79794.1 probable GTP-binding protein [Bdellovibrio bacteriovorus HD100]